jgi:superfamily II DNA or RNA helicase
MSEIHNFPADLVEKLCKSLSYVNKSVSYSIKKFTRNKQRALFILMNRHHLNDIEDAKAKYDEEVEKMKKLQNVTLIKVQSDGTILIPTGLLTKLRQFLVENMVRDVYEVDLRVKPVKSLGFPVSSAPMELYPFQKIAVQACLDKCQGVVESATGSGKTLIMQEVIKRLGLKALIVVPTLSILNQTVKRFTEYFGSKRVGKYTSATTKIRDIMVGCAPSVAKSDKAIWANRDVLGIDEGHHTPARTIEKICYEVVPDAYYRFAFSATSYRSDGADLAIEAAMSPKIFSYDINQAIKDGFLADPTFIMFNINESTGMYGGEDTLKAYKSHVLYNQCLNKAVIKQTNQFIAEGKRVLIMVREKEHGNALQSGIPGSVFVRTKETKIEDSYTAPTMDTDKAIREFNARHISCLIGTSIIGEGTDILPVDVVIMLTSVASRVAVMQNIGRGLRKCEGKTGVIIIDYIFNVHPSLKRHSKMRLTYYQGIKKVNVLTLDREGNIEEFKNKT